MAAIVVNKTDTFEVQRQKINQIGSEFDTFVTNQTTLNSTFIELTDISVTKLNAGTANLQYDNTTGVLTYTPPDLSNFITSIGDAIQDADFTTAGLMKTDGAGNYSVVTDNSSNWIALTDLSVTQLTAGNNGLSYDNSTGVLTFTPQDVSGFLSLTGISVNTLTASAGGALSYSNTTGVFSYTPPDLTGYLTSLPTHSIDDHDDVDTTGVADGKILKYDASASSFVIADDGGGTIPDLQDVCDQDPVTTTDLTAKDLICADAGLFQIGTSQYATIGYSNLGKIIYQGNNSGFDVISTSLNWISGSTTVAELSSTGLNIIGTVTSDGSTTDGDATFKGGTADLVWDKSDNCLYFYGGTTIKDASGDKGTLGQVLGANGAAGLDWLDFDLDNLANVNITSLQDTQTIKWDAASNKWVNASSAGGSGGEGISLSDISVGANGTATGGGSLSYNDITGVFTFSPAVVGNFIQLTDISVGAEGAAAGDGGITYDDSTGVLTYSPPDLSGYLTGYTETADLQDVTTNGSTTNVATTIFTGGTGAARLDVQNAGGYAISLNAASGVGINTADGVGLYIGNISTNVWRAKIEGSTGDITGNKFVKTSGTSSQFLKADGSVDSSTYLTSIDISSENLNDLADVNAGTPTDGHVLKWDAGTSKWIAAADQTATGGSGISLTDLSVTTNTAGTAALSYNTSNGVFSYTPPDLSSVSTDLTVFSIGSNATASGGGGLAYNNTNGVFTYTPPDLSSYITGLSMGELDDVTITGSPAINSVLKWSGTAWINGTVASGGLDNVVEDTSPQLGGNLDCQSANVDFYTGGACFGGNSGSYAPRLYISHTTTSGGTSFIDDASGNGLNILYGSGSFGKVVVKNRTGSTQLTINDANGVKVASKLDLSSATINDGTSTGTSGQVLTSTVTGVAWSTGLTLSSLSIGSEGTASGDGSISYNNTNGVFTYTPPDLSDFLDSTSALADLSDVVITGSPQSGQVIKWDNATSKWTNQADAAGGAVAAGLDTQVQFNDGGNLAGDSALTWSKSSDILTLDGQLNIPFDSTTTGTNPAIKIGAGGDWEAFHNGSSTCLRNQFGTYAVQNAADGGELHLQAYGNIKMSHMAGVNYVFCNELAGVDLFHNGTWKLKTHADGVEINGVILDAQGDKGSSGQILSSTGTSLNWVTPSTNLSNSVLGDLQDVTIAGSPSNNQFLRWNGSTWTNQTVTIGTGTVTQVTGGTGLSGTVTTTGSLSLSSSGVSSGTYATPSSITVDTYGRITSITGGSGGSGSAGVYRVHQSASSGTLAINSNANGWLVIVVGGGGGAGVALGTSTQGVATGGGGGGGAVMWFYSKSEMGTGTMSWTIGSAGSSPASGISNGGNGGGSTFSTGSGGTGPSLSAQGGNGSIFHGISTVCGDGGGPGNGTWVTYDGDTTAVMRGMDGSNGHAVEGSSTCKGGRPGFPVSPASGGSNWGRGAAGAASNNTNWAQGGTAIEGICTIYEF